MWGVFHRIYIGFSWLHIVIVWQFLPSAFAFFYSAIQRHPAGLHPSPFVCGAPFPLLSAPRMARGVRARAAKMCGGVRTHRKGSQLDGHSFDEAVHWKRQTLSAEDGFGDWQSFVVRYVVKCGFSGLLVAAEPGKMRRVAQKIRFLGCACYAVLFQKNF